MKQWLTAREIADEALPDLPSTKRGVNELAERERWNDNPALARERSGRGGGAEYHIHLLPILAQIAYAQKHMAVGAPEDSAEAASEDALSGRARQQRDARLAIVTAFQRFSRGLQLGHASRLQIFTDKYNAGSISVEDWVRSTIPTISKRSLMRWRSARRDGRSDRLGFDRGASRKGTGVLEQANDGQVRSFILGLIAQQPHLSAEQVRTQCRDTFGDTIKVVSRGVERRIAMPPTRTFQHTLKQLKTGHQVELTKLTNPDLYRSTLAPAGRGALRHIRDPNQLWQIDASPVDALCSDGRHSIYGCIDIATRRTVWQVSRTPRASAVALLIRKAILAWGTPDVIKTDNGTDFVARDTQRLFVSLDIEAEVSDAYQPQQKGHVERVIGTFQRDCAALLPGFVGHSVADRKAIESRKSFADRLGESEAETFGVSLSGAELQGLVDRWAAEIYQHRPHEGLGRRTPHDVAAASLRPRRDVDERALDLLLMPVAGGNGRRRVTKFGIRIDHHHYQTPTILPGTDVFVRMDPNDLGRAFAFEPDGCTYLGEAICPELAGVSAAALTRATKEMHAEILKEKTRDIRAEMKRIAKGPALIEKALNVAAKDAARRAAEQANIIPLPQRSVEHSTPQIAAALDAMAPRKATTALDERAAELHREMLAEQAATVPKATVTPLRKEETQHHRFRRALDIERRIAAGEPVAPEEAVWLGGYQSGPEYRALRSMFDEFGEAMSL